MNIFRTDKYLLQNILIFNHLGNFGIIRPSFPEIYFGNIKILRGVDFK